MSLDDQVSTKERLVLIFDKNYCSRALLAINSSKVEFKNISILALDEETKQIVKSHLGINAISYQDFVAQTPGLEGILQTRSFVERIFTIGPIFARSIAQAHPENDWIVYCDSDLYFHMPARDVIGPYSQNSALIVSHRHFPWNKRRLRKYGEFNVGLVAFKNDHEGNQVLDYWANSCIEWCKDEPENNRYADQKYLEDFQGVSTKVGIDIRKGSNLAPWNIKGTSLSVDWKGQIRVYGEPVLYTHMQGLWRFENRWMLSHHNYLYLASRKVVDLIYMPYLKKLEALNLELGLTNVSGSRPPQNQLRYRLRHYLSWLLVLLGQGVKIKNTRKAINN